MNEKLKKILETIENFVLTSVGHACSGAGIGILYELEKLWATGSPMSAGVVLSAVAIGGAIGFFKTIIEELEKLKKTTAVGSTKAKKAYFI